MPNIPEYHDPMMYRNGNEPGSRSTMYPQLVDFYYLKKALIDEKKEMYFSQLSDTFSMP